jgi:hypothetical protein
MKIVKLEQPDDLQKSLEQMKRMMPYILEMYVLTAVAKKRHYDELIKAGFSEDQALKLCESLT